MSVSVKKKGKKRKVKESPPDKTLSTNEILNLPKSETKEEVIFNDFHNELETQVEEITDQFQPEPGQEPIGPEQNLPASSEITEPPVERKVTSYINVSNLYSFK